MSIAAILAASAGLALAACQGQPLQSAAGGGSPLAAAVPLIGGGGSLTSLLTSVATTLLGDAMQAQQDVSQALAQNQPVTLRAPQNARVVIRPVRTFERDGRLCREFALTAEAAAGPFAQRQALACEVSAGRWQLVQPAA